MENKELQFENFLKGYMTKQGLNYMSAEEVLNNYQECYPDEVYQLENLNEHKNKLSEKEYNENKNEILNEVWTFTQNIEKIIETAIEQNAKYNNRIIEDYDNDAGNLSIKVEELEDDNEDEDYIYSIFSGFEYYAYFNDNRWLTEAEKQLNNIQW